MKISEITNEQALHVGKIVGLNFLSFEYITEENKEAVKLNLGQTHGFIHFLKIYMNGTITLTKQTGAYGHKLTVINTLPIIDYLKNEGFKFKY